MSVNVEKFTPVQESFFKDYFEGHEKYEVFLLSENDAVKSWRSEIDSASASYFDLPDSSWIIQGNSCIIGEWKEAYNNDDNEEVAAYLTQSLDWPYNANVRFFAKKGIVFKTKWSNFLKIWDDFIAVEDDCPILIHENNPKEAVIFSPLGDILKIKGGIKGSGSRGQTP